MRWLRIGGIVIAAIALVLISAAAALYALSERRFSRQYEVAVPALTGVGTDATTDHGRHVATIRGCVDCHQRDLGGRVMEDSGVVGRISAPNLTRGKGGVGAQLTEENFIRSVRHGVGRDGRSLRVMPSQEFWVLTDTDTAALLAYVRSVPPVDREVPQTRIALPLRALFVLNRDVKLLPAELIDHEAQRPALQDNDPHAMGKYLAVSCIGCHGDGLAGGEIPGMPPEWPPAPNLTPAGNLKAWSKEAFAAAMRTGRTPDGRLLDRRFMPWPAVGALKNAEIDALWGYLQSVPARPTGSR